MSPARTTGLSGAPVAVSQRRASPLKSVETIFVPSGLNCTEENVLSGFASKVPVAGLLVATSQMTGAPRIYAAARRRPSGLKLTLCAGSGQPGSIGGPTQAPVRRSHTRILA